MNLFKIAIRIPSWLVRNRFLLMNKWRFKHVGKKVRVYKPLKIDGIENIQLGDNVVVHDGTWLAAMPLTGYDVKLILEDGATLGNFNHIYATQSIIIEKDVLTADKVYISDNLHSYEDISSVDNFTNPEILDLKNELNKLTPQERKLIIARYYEELTQSETSNILGMSQVQVSRNENKILKKLRTNL